ncbi:hypothetical protein YPPY34_3562 [Yersinia pestis PY-34]
MQEEGKGYSALDVLTTYLFQNLQHLENERNKVFYQKYLLLSLL